MAKRQKPKNPRGTEVYSPEQIEKILAAFHQTSAIGVRNRAIVAVGLYSQARISEILALRLDDIDPDFRGLFVRRGKGGRRRSIGLHPKGVAPLKDWLTRRWELKIDSWLVFVTKTGGPIDTGYIREMTSRIGKKAGLGKRLHMHGLRATGSTWLAKNGTNIMHISKQLGHSALSTTSIYIRGFMDEETVEAIHNANM